MDVHVTFSGVWLTFASLIGQEWEVLMLSLTIHLLGIAAARPPLHAGSWGEFVLIMVPTILLVFYPQYLVPVFLISIVGIVLKAVLAPAPAKPRDVEGAGAESDADTKEVADDETEQPRKKEKKNAVKEDKKYIPHVTVLRSTIITLTMAAILAVDFAAFFPVRFAKTHEWGVSLMDLGVGCICYTGGVSAGLKISRGHRQTAWQTLIQSLPLFIIGFARAVIVKLAGLSADASEFGRHWTFFTTLAFLPIVNYAVPLVARTPLAILTMVAWELALQLKPALLQFALAPVSPFDNVFAANREGFFTLPAYISIFLIASYVGSSIKAGGRKSVPMPLLFMNAIAWMSYTLLKFAMHNQVSRRAGNLQYVQWIISFAGVHHLLSLAIFLIPPYARNVKLGVPILYDAINGNQLVLFILANVLVGTLRYFIPLKAVGHFWIVFLAMALYMGVICAVGMGLRYLQRERKRHKHRKDASVAEKAAECLKTAFSAV